MLQGMSGLDMGRLRMSVGYSTHKKGRPLSPIEVGLLFRKALDSGAELSDCADAVGLKGTSQVSRFVKVAALAPDIRHLVDWGRSRETIGFTTAVELARVEGLEEQKAVAKAILEEGLTTDEVRQVAQILRRSRKPVGECLREIVAMRPTVERKVVFIGAVEDQAVRERLARLTQAQRNQALQLSLGQLDIPADSGRLGAELFTLIGDDSLDAAIAKRGKESLEHQLVDLIAEYVENVESEN